MTPSTGRAGIYRRERRGAERVRVQLHASELVHEDNVAFPLREQRAAAAVKMLRRFS